MVASCVCPADADPSYLSREDAVVKRSVYTECVVEADRFKWIASEKAGYDLGETAIRQWVRDHWTGYLRARWVEHLQGTTFWVELDRGDFGLLSRDFPSDRDLMNCVLELLKAGQENLDVICWAHHHHIPSDSVVSILEALDINARRLLYKFDANTTNRN